MPSKKAGVLLCTGVLVGTSGCGLLFEYPETEDEDERSAAACKDGSDNDHNGLIDCEDRANCAGFCPELSDDDCSDGADNDGDALSDANDPSCWPVAPPVLRRCADRAEIHFVAPFNGRADLLPYSGGDKWFVSGIDASGDQRQIVLPASSPLLVGGFASFCFNTSGEPRPDVTTLGSATARRSFVGSWRGLDLSFDAAVPLGAVARVALVPEALATGNAPPTTDPETALVTVGLDNSKTPPVFTLDAGDAHLTAELPSVDACGDAHLCNAGFRGVRLRVVDAGFEASLGDSDVVLKAPLGSEAMPPSRLVLLGGSGSPDQCAGIDNVDLRMPAEAPCGVPVPQIPSSSCEVTEQLVSVGPSIAMARAPEGEFCALASATALSAEPVVSVWMSDDGDVWHAARDEFLEMPGADAVIGASIVHDGERFRAAVAYREGGEARLAFANSQSCAGLTRLEAGLVLPIDAEAPSYVETTDPLAIYFTRPPTGELGRTLWRISGADADSLALEPYPVAELASIGAPVVIQKVGAQDLVMTYPKLAPNGIPSIGVAVSASAALGTDWTPVELSTEAVATSPLSFDSEGIAGVSLSWDRDRGLLLYAGSKNQALSIGTAQLLPAGAPLPKSSENPKCGDGQCGELEGESCETCPFDCECTGAPLLEHPFDPERGWVFESKFGIVDAVGDQIVISDSGMASFELETPVSGDFELGFDVTFSVYGGSYCSAFQVALVSSNDPDALTEGVFAHFGNVCYASFSGLPAVGTATEPFNVAFHPLDTCGTSLINIPEDVTQRVLLRREGAHVTLESADAHACGAPAVDYTGALSPLRTLLVGIPDSDGQSCPDTIVSVSALSLRLLDDPKQCASPHRLCPDAEGLLSCIDVAESQEHCGECGAACGPNADCVRGVCQCDAGYGMCGGDCTDLMTSVEHCGACNLACSRNCFRGECNVGEDCSSPKALPPDGGTLHFDLQFHTTDVPFCNELPATHDAVFAWTPSTSGEASIQVFADGAPFTNTMLGVALSEACDSPEEWLACNDFGESDEAILPVQAGTTYTIIVALWGDASPVNSSEATLEIEVN